MKSSEYGRLNKRARIIFSSKESAENAAKKMVDVTITQENNKWVLEGAFPIHVKRPAESSF